MTYLTNNGNFAMIVNKDESFTVHYGYTNGTNNAYGNETCTGRKTYKSEKSAVKFANKYLGL